jgi:hypothetical protein
MVRHARIIVARLLTARGVGAPPRSGKPLPPRRRMRHGLCGRAIRPHGECRRRWGPTASALPVIRPEGFGAGDGEPSGRYRTSTLSTMCTTPLLQGMSACTTRAGSMGYLPPAPKPPAPAVSM